MNNVKTLGWIGGICLFLGTALSLTAMFEGSMLLLIAALLALAAGAFAMYRIMKLTL
ncbi:MAG: hypothetical protein HUJ54_07865 [Erysipelotrichaceae bacterium]|nr:hypothetical protein [Erysipelotrichaceae bacterium]